MTPAPPPLPRGPSNPRVQHLQPAQRRLEVLDLGMAGPAAPSLRQGLRLGDLRRGLLAAAKGPRPYPALHSLGLAGQRELAADAAAVAQAAPSLQRLDLRGTLDLVAPLATALPGLEVLLASGAHPCLQDADVAALAAAAPRLRVLDMSQQDLLGNTALKALGGCCKYLTEVVLSRQHKLTPSGLWDLINGAPALRTVVAVRCRRLGPKALKRMRTELRGAGRCDLRILEEREEPRGPWWAA